MFTGPRLEIKVFQGADIKPKRPGHKVGLAICQIRSVADRRGAPPQHTPSSRITTGLIRKMCRRS